VAVKFAANEGYQIAMKNCRRLPRFEWLVAIFLLLVSSRSFALDTVDWTEDALLHDGQTLKVSLRATNRIDASMPWLGYFNFQKSSLDTFRIEFRHPGTRARVIWEGIRGFQPILLDVLDGVPYLVILGRPNKESSAVYGCPELPYIYLQYDGFNWKPVTLEMAPPELKSANISTHGVWSGYEGHHFDVASTARLLVSAASSSGGAIQVMIPRTYDEWNYAGKKGARDERQFGDCRPPRQPATPKISAPIDVKLEVLEAIDLPESKAREYLESTRNSIAIQAKSCEKFFAQIDPMDKLLGERFVLDQSNQKLLPYPGSPPIRNLDYRQQRAFRYCNTDYVWFVAPFEEKGKVLITKYSTAGDFIYNVRIQDQGSWRYDRENAMRHDLMRLDDGYLYFYWAQSLSTMRETYEINLGLSKGEAASAVNEKIEAIPKRITKLRFKEPIQDATMFPNR
jgi:hypothetical protein